MSKGKPSTYIPRYPREVVEQRKTLFCSELDQLSNELTSLYDRQIENESLNALLIRGFDSISAKMMEMMDRTRRSIMIMGTFVSPVEIEQLNKKIIKAKKKDVTVRILVITSRSKESEAAIIKAFGPIRNDVRLHAPQLEDPNKLDDRYGDDGSGIARWVITDRREILLALTRADDVGIECVDRPIFDAPARLRQTVGGLRADRANQLNWCAAEIPKLCFKVQKKGRKK